MIVETLSPDERIDRFARRVYGSERGGTVEALLDANPGLADLDNGIIPGATPIEVPDVPAAQSSQYILAWE